MKYVVGVWVVSGGKKRLFVRCGMLHSCVSKERGTFMSDQNSQIDGNSLLKSSSLYREFQAEREEILRHKWLESEKAGYDIGFEWALTDWIMKHRGKWRKSRQMEHRVTATA